MFSLRQYHKIFICVVAAVLAFGTQSGFAQFDPSITLRDDNINSLPVKVFWSNRLYTNADAGKTGDQFAFSDSETSLQIPLFGSDNDYDLSAQLKYRQLHFKHDSFFGTPARSFPDDLYDISVGLTGRKLTDIGLFGLSAAVKSASDRPFNSTDESAVSIGSWWTIQTSRQNAFQLMLYYDSDLDIAGGAPLPGAAWIYSPSRKFTLTLGVPASSIIYRPTEKLELFALGTVMNSAKAKVSYSLCEYVKLYGIFDWQGDSFNLHDRKDNDHKLHYRETTATIGTRFDITDSIYIDLDGGWSFNRYFFEAEDYSDRHDNRLNLDDAAFIGLTASIAF